MKSTTVTANIEYDGKTFELKSIVNPTGIIETLKK
jgi:hypothetical protein